MSSRAGSTGTLQEQLVASFKALSRTTDKADRTKLLKQIAQQSVDLREFFTTASGDPDWKGATHLYRQAVKQAYTEAGYSNDEATTVMSAVRYHTSSYLREKLGEETIAELGLRPEDRTEASREARAVRSDLLRSAAETMRLQKGDVSVLRNLAAVAMVLDKTTADEVAGVSDGEREELLNRLGAIGRRVAELEQLARGGGEKPRAKGRRVTK